VNARIVTTTDDPEEVARGYMLGVPTVKAPPVRVVCDV
jgi:hypothetical protein